MMPPRSGPTDAQLMTAVDWANFTRDIDAVIANWRERMDARRQRLLDIRLIPTSIGE